MPAVVVLIEDSPKRKLELSPVKKYEPKGAESKLRYFADIWPQYAPSPVKKVRTSSTAPRLPDSVERELAAIEMTSSQSHTSASLGTCNSKSLLAERGLSQQTQDVISQIRVASHFGAGARSRFEIFGSFKCAAMKHSCDIDCIERVTIPGNSLEDAARVAASLLKEVALRLKSSRSAVFVELKAGLDHNHAEKYAEITTGPLQNGSNWERKVLDALGREDVQHRHIALRRLHYNLRRIRWNAHDLGAPTPVKDLDVYGQINLIEAILNSDRIMIVALLLLPDGVLMEASNMVMLEWVPNNEQENTKALSRLCLQWPTDRLVNLMEDSRNYIYLGLLVKAAKRMWSVLLTVASTNDSCVSYDARNKAHCVLQRLLPFFEVEGGAAALVKLVKDIDVVIKANELSSSSPSVRAILPKTVERLVRNLKHILENLPSTLLCPDEAFFRSMLAEIPDLQASIHIFTTAKTKLDALSTRLAKRFFDDTFDGVDNLELSIDELLLMIPPHAQTRCPDFTIPVPLTITQASAAARGLSSCKRFQR